MKYQIIDWRGNVVDQNLSYEEALTWIDCPVGRYYTMEPMKKEGKNGRKSKKNSRIYS